MNYRNLGDSDLEVSEPSLGNRRATRLLHQVGLLAFGLLTGKYRHGNQPVGARLTEFAGFGARY